MSSSEFGREGAPPSRRGWIKAGPKSRSGTVYRQVSQSEEVAEEAASSSKKFRSSSEEIKLSFSRLTMMPAKQAVKRVARKSLSLKPRAKRQILGDLVAELGLGEGGTHGV